MASRVLWLLDNETDDRTFERLCTSLMYRWGYRKIIPIGRTADRGRDAEAEVAQGKGQGAERVFFQYTLERRWEPKLLRELEKVRRNGHAIDKFVFVTRSSVTGASRDKHTKSALEKYGWKLELFDREWLRHQLEEVHPSLVRDYLLQGEFQVDNTVAQLELLPPPEGEARHAWQLFVHGEYESSIPGLRRMLASGESKAPTDEIWAALAWCYYCLFNYGDALACIENALAIDSKSSRHRTIKGCILCEHGSETGVRSLLVSSKAIFQDLVIEAKDYGAYYNLGNALSGLEEYSDARDAYIEALNFNDKVAEVWKNLGTCYFHLQEHQQELECYDTALRLNPRLSHALVSKANTTAVVFHDFDEALRLLEQAGQVDTEIGRRWPHFHWWKAYYLLQLDRPHDALTEVDAGLTRRPEQERLLDLKARIVSKLWRMDPTARSSAKSFFVFRLQANPSEIPSLLQLAELSNANNDLDEVFDSLSRAFNAAAGSDIHTPNDLKDLSDLDRLMLFSRHLPGYSTYRRARPLQLPEDRVSAPDHCGFRHLWIVFGLAYTDLVHKVPSADAAVADVVEFCQSVRTAVAIAIRAVAVKLAAEFRDADVQTKTKIMSLSLVALAEAAFYESTWLSGYLPAAKGVPEDLFAEANEQFIQQNDLSPFREDVLDAVVRPLNEAWHLMRDERDVPNHEAG